MKLYKAHDNYSVYLVGVAHSYGESDNYRRMNSAFLDLSTFSDLCCLIVNYYIVNWDNIMKRHRGCCLGFIQQ